MVILFIMILLLYCNLNKCLIRMHVKVKKTSYLSYTALFKNKINVLMKQSGNVIPSRRHTF